MAWPHSLIICSLPSFMHWATTLIKETVFNKFLLISGMATTVYTCAKSRATSELHSVVVSSTFAWTAISFNWPTTMSYSSNRLQELYSFSTHTLQIHRYYGAAWNKLFPGWKTATWNLLDPSMVQKFFRWSSIHLSLRNLAAISQNM